MGKISELINQMIQRMLESSEWTSANPTHINTFIQANSIDNPDFEREIKNLTSQGNDNTKVLTDEKSKENKKVIEKLDIDLDSLKKGNVGKFQKFTQEQFSNISGVANNPIGFLFGKIGTKLARGGVILGLVLLVEQIIHFSIAEMMKPGRILDRRLKVIIDDQIILFTRRNELAELRQGFRTVYVTASPFIRGNPGIIGSNLYIHNGGITKNFQQPHTINNISTATTNTNMPGGTRH